MRIWPPRCEIALKDDEGMIRFGRTEWVEGDRLSCELDQAPAVGHVCDVSIRVTDLHTSINTSARVASVAPGSMGQHRVLLDLAELSSGPRQTWEAWLASVSASVSRTPSGVRMGLEGPQSGRRGLARALKEAAPPPVPIPTTPPDPAGTRDDRALSWPSADTVEVRWGSATSLRRSLKGRLRRGRIKLKGNPHGATQVTLKLGLPDGQVLTLPASIEARGSIRPELRFQMTLALRHKLLQAAL